MRPILLDTNAYTAFKLADKPIVDLIKHAEIIGLSPIVLGELLGGFDSGTKAKKNREELQQFLNSSRIRIYPLTADTANFYSHIYAALKKKGYPIPTNDLWIAAQSMEHGCALCTYDKHFKAIEGLLTGTTCAELII
jgi:predicted nucleic acid-binding protein